MAIAIIMRPWKLEGYGGEYLEIGVWTLCRVTPKFYICYPDFYDQTINEYDQSKKRNAQEDARMKKMR